MDKEEETIFDRLLSNKGFRATAKKTWQQFSRPLPTLFGLFLLIIVFLALTPKSLLTSILTRFAILDAVVGSLVGGILAGSQLIAYMFAGELWQRGLSYAFTGAFLAAWSTVNLIHFPAEASLLGKRYARIRNCVNAALAVVVGILLWLLMGVFS